VAIATLPSPLYGLYRTRDHLSALTITVVFAIFAGQHDRHAATGQLHRRAYRAPGHDARRRRDAAQRSDRL
jgi:hypothetical protein